MVVLILLLAGGYLVLNSGAFQRYAIAKIVQKADEATNGKLAIQKLDLQLSTLTAHLYGVSFRGTERPQQPPLLQVDKLTVGLKIQSVLRRKITLSELLIEHPVAHLLIDKNGQSNLPEPAAQKKNSNGPSIFDLAVGRTLLSNGEIYCNDKKSQVEANLHNLQTDVHYQFIGSKYVGSLSYDNGVLQYANYTPYAHSLKLQFTATPSSFSLNPLQFTIASSHASLRADVNNFQAPKVAGSYDIEIHAQDLAPLSPSVKPEGDLALSGTISYDGAASGPFLRDVHVEGELHGRGIQGSSPSGALAISKLDGHYQLANGALQSRDITAELLNGRLRADLLMQHLEATPHARLRASLENISIDSARQALRDPQVRTLPLTGTIDGGVAASWTGSPENIKLTSHLEIHAATWNQIGGVPQLVPIDGNLHANYDGARNLVTLKQTSLHAAATTINVQGQVGKQSNLQVRLNASDLSQLNRLAPLAGSSRAQVARVTSGISGSAALNISIRGSMQRPQIRGDFNAQNLETRGTAWKAASLTFTADPSQVNVQKASLVSVRQGSATAKAQIALNRWSFAPSNRISANVSIHQFAIAELQHLAGVQYPVSGNITADLSVSGSQLNPVGNGSVQLASARAYGEPIQNFNLKFNAANGSLESTLAVSLSAGSANADLHYTPKTKAYSFKFDAPAVVLEKLQTVEAKNTGLQGTVNASAQGEGTLDNPNLTALIQIARLQMRQTAITGMKAQLNVANQKANLALSSDVSQAHIEAHGSVKLTADHYADLTVDTNRVPLGPFLALYAANLPQGFQGETELHATLKGPLQNKSQLEAHVTIPTFSASYQNLQVASAGPIRAAYAHSLITLQPAEIRGTGTSLRFQGTMPLTGNAVPSLSASGTLDLRIAQIVMPDIKSGGTVNFDVRSSGKAFSAVTGEVRIQDAAFATAAAPLGVEKLNGELDLQGDRLQVKTLTAQVGGGNVSAGGFISLRPTLQFNVAMQGQSVRLRYPDGVRTLLDTNLTVTGNTTASIVTGRILIDSLSFTQDFDLSQFADQFGGSSAVATGESFADNMKLQIAVQSTENLNATSSQVSLTGTADLRVIGTAANPVIVGRADLTSGELFFRSNRYQLERGLITFDNPTETEPVLNMAVSTTIEQYNLTITLRGPLDRLQTSYVSDPPLATADVINLLARGQTTEESGASSTSPDSILAGQVAGQFTGGIQKLAGISSLQIDPLIGGSNPNPSARVALQQRVTKNLLFTFSTDVTQPGTEVVEGDYQINPRWSVSVARDELGGVSVDGRFHTKF